MAKGTWSRRARVWASAVLPQPVGPISRTLLLATSTSFRVGSSDLAAHDPLVVVDDGDGQRPLHAVLADDVVVEVGDQLAGGRQLLELGVLPLVLGEDPVARLGAVGADVGDRPAAVDCGEGLALDHRPGLAGRPPAEVARRWGALPGRCRRRSVPSTSSLRLGSGGRRWGRPDPSRIESRGDFDNPSGRPSSRRDSNPRRPAYKAGALTAELREAVSGRRMPGIIAASGRVCGKAGTAAGPGGSRPMGAL